jgi:hypothetical protein
MSIAKIDECCAFEATGQGRANDLNCLTVNLSTLTSLKALLLYSVQSDLQAKQKY